VFFSLQPFQTLEQNFPAKMLSEADGLGHSTPPTNSSTSSANTHFKPNSASQGSNNTSNAGGSRRPRKSMARSKFDLSRFSTAHMKLQKQQQEFPDHEQQQPQQQQQSPSETKNDNTSISNISSNGSTDMDVDGALTMDELMVSSTAELASHDALNQNNNDINASNNETSEVESSSNTLGTPSEEEIAKAHHIFLQRQREISTELLAEHFGFAPTEFIDDVINTMNEIVYEAMAEFQYFVEAEGVDQDEAEKGIAALETLVESAVDKNFDKFEIFVLNNVFNIPSHLSITLPHYQVWLRSEAFKIHLIQTDWVVACL
jgi:hypothetical protein